MHEPDTSPIPTLPPRDPNAHKGTGGTVLIVGGSVGAEGDRREQDRVLGAVPLAAHVGGLRVGEPKGEALVEDAFVRAPVREPRPSLVRRVEDVVRPGHRGEL